MCDGHAESRAVVGGATEEEGGEKLLGRRHGIGGRLRVELSSFRVEPGGWWTEGEGRGEG